MNEKNHRNEIPILIIMDKKITGIIIPVIKVNEC